VDTKNRGEAMVYETEKFLKDNGEKIPSDKKMKVENAVEG
jgi:molecular chaperone DnaK